jgi:hypothetical protein
VLPDRLEVVPSSIVVSQRLSYDTADEVYTECSPEQEPHLFALLEVRRLAAAQRWPGPASGQRSRRTPLRHCCSGHQSCCRWSCCPGGSGGRACCFCWCLLWPHGECSSRARPSAGLHAMVWSQAGPSLWPGKKPFQGNAAQS